MYEFEYKGRILHDVVKKAVAEMGLTTYDVKVKVLNVGGFLKKARVKIFIPEESRSKNEKIKAFLQAAKERELALQTEITDDKNVGKQDKTNKVQKTQTPAKAVKQNSTATPKKNAYIGENIEFEIKQTARNSFKNIANRAHDKQKNYMWDFLCEYFSQLGVKAEIKIIENPRSIKVEIQTQTDNKNPSIFGKIIGKNGSSIKLLQSLLSNECTQKFEKAKVVLLDINNFTELLKKEVEQKLNKKIEALKNVGDFFEVNEKVGEKRKQIFEIVAKNKNLKIETVTKNKIKILVVTKIN